jgi:CRISPR-associated endoribonuclease Cas6
MRIRLGLSPRPGEALLPRRYQHVLGSAIYKLLPKTGQHESKHTKLFCVSPLFWKNREVSKENIRFKGDGFLIFCSTDLNQINEIFTKTEAEIGGNLFDINRTELVDDPFFSEEMIWRTPAGGGAILTRISRKETRSEVHLSPKDSPVETARHLERNLKYRWKQLCHQNPKKAVLWSDSEDPVKWGEEQVVEVDFSGTKTTTHFGQIKKAALKGWSSTLKVKAPEPFQRLIWSCGLGSKTAFGFGYVEPLQT